MPGELRVWMLIWAPMHSPSVLTWRRVDNLSGLQIFHSGKVGRASCKILFTIRATGKKILQMQKQTIRRDVKMNFRSYRGKISALFKEAKNSLFQKKKCNKLSNSSTILKIQKIKVVAQSSLDKSVLIYMISAVLVIFHFCTCC